MQNQRYLGCDFGTNNIGFAIGQTFTKSASPIAVIKAKEGVPVNWSEIDSIINQWRPHAIVMGLPLNIDGTATQMSKLVQKFADSLQERTKLEIHFIDEHLSSKTIRDQIKYQKQDQARSKSKNKLPSSKARIDALSACLILESWFNNLA